MAKLAGWFLLLFPSLLIADPNLQSYKKAGECSSVEIDSNCFYCPAKRKFIALGENSEDLRIDAVSF